MKIIMCTLLLMCSVVQSQCQMNTLAFTNESSYEICVLKDGKQWLTEKKYGERIMKQEVWVMPHQKFVVEDLATNVPSQTITLVFVSHKSHFMGDVSYDKVLSTNNLLNKLVVGTNCLPQVIAIDPKGLPRLLP